MTERLPSSGRFAGGVTGAGPRMKALRLYMQMSRKWFGYALAEAMTRDKNLPTKPYAYSRVFEWERGDRTIPSEIVQIMDGWEEEMKDARQPLVQPEA